MASKVGSVLHSGFKLLLKPANPLRPLDDSIKDLEGGVTSIYRAGREAFRAEETDPIAERLRHIADARERFDIAMEHYGVARDDLSRIEDGARARFHMLFLMTVLAIGYAIVSPRLGLLGNSGITLLDHALPWFICFPLLALTVRASFRLHQLRCRALVPFGHWLRDPAAWLGAGCTALVRGLALFLFAAAAVNSVSAASALAQTVPGAPQTVPGATTATDLGSIIGWATTMMHEHDLSLEWLRRMFPGAASAWGGPDTDTDILQVLFTAFNTVLLALGSGLLSWQIVAGTVSSAYSGKVLGDRYHQWWSPMRIIMGVGLLGPVKGYCMAQILVIQLIFVGYSAANGMWSLYVTTMLNPTSSAVLVGPKLDVGNNLAARALQAETCAHVVTTLGKNLTSEEGSWWNRIRLSWFKDDRMVAQFPPTTGTPIDGARVWDFGRVCGSFKVGETSAGLAFEADAHTRDSSGEQAAYAAFDAKRSELFSQFLAAVRETGLAQDIAASVIPGGEAVDAAQSVEKTASIKAAAARYNGDVTAAAKELAAALDVERRTRFAKTSTDLGWASAGALNFTLARLSAAANDRAAGAYPDVESVDALRLSEENAKTLDAALGNLQVLIRDTSVSDYLERADTQVREDLMSVNPLVVLLKPATDALAKGLANAAQLDEIHPISSIMALGNTTLVTGEALLVGWIGLRASASAAEKALENGLTNATAAPASAAKGAIEAATPFADVIIGALILFGALNAYVIPLVPFILWYFAVLACATYAAEIVIGAPLAALLHIKMDGNELIDQPQRAIYVIVFNAALRPTLLLFGLILANTLFSVMAGYLNKMFSVAMFSSQGNNIIGIVGIITMMAILLYLHYQLATRSYALVHQIPSMVSHLLGAQDGSRNEGDDTKVVIGAITTMSRTGSTTVASRAFIPKAKPDQDGPRAPTKEQGGDTPKTEGGNANGGGSDVSKVKARGEK